MCVKIVKPESEQEFDMLVPLETQVEGAKEIQVHYDPTDPKIESFVANMERLVGTGATYSFEIKVDPSNDLDGYRLERKLEKIKFGFELNEVIKGLALFHTNADSRLCEIGRLCAGKHNE